MHSFRKTVFAVFMAIVVGATGCCFKRDCLNLCNNDCAIPPTQPGFGLSQLQSSDPCLDSECAGNGPEAGSPFDIREDSLTDDKLRVMTLDECIQQALATSTIMRDLGATVIRSPQTINTRLDPSLVYTDPRAGEEAALSAFDSNFFLFSSFEQNDRRLNNQFFGNQGFFNQDLSVTQFGFNKRSATGALFNVRSVTTYDLNNQLGNGLGPRTWDTYVEGEVRQPLLQGAGSEFVRIAGPGAVPGQLNGVLLARVRTDISLTDFERSVRDLVAEVENAYWDLYYSYRDLEAKIQVRDIAERTLQTVANKDEGEAARAQAEEQVHRFQSDVLDALNGRPIDGTRTNNGSSGGTFRGTGGLRVAERKLRLLIGLPINDGMLIRPASSPAVAPVAYDWQEAIQNALQNREELRRQRWVIKQRELELVANRNFLKPQLDVVSRYRVRGFGQDLLGSTQGAVNDMYTGDLQEWQLGLEYNLPVGFRRAHAAVRNAQLGLSREVEVLREQERQVHFGLSNAMNECTRSFDNMILQEKRLKSIVAQLNALNLKREKGEKPELDVELETHRRLLDARLRFHQAQVEYQLALRNVHFEQGTLLAYSNIRLSESISGSEAYADGDLRVANQVPGKAPAGRDPVIGGKVDHASSAVDSFPVDGLQPVLMDNSSGSLGSSTLAPAPVDAPATPAASGNPSGGAQQGPAGSASGPADEKNNPPAAGSGGGALWNRSPPSGPVQSSVIRLSDSF